ncbi:hypothetical protein F2P81_005435 [Scophthalmus maximus]|uniref:Uncharacterized protein n=1 Tax=Scophthalmus maximus TaxID=52904 RepID=A0A6A4T790_SCOMX|nr:hypothetical protein F2P81_005435 [Scophthalmus maximus]
MLPRDTRLHIKLFVCATSKYQFPVRPRRTFTISAGPLLLFCTSHSTSEDLQVSGSRSVGRKTEEMCLHRDAHRGNLFANECPTLPAGKFMQVHSDASFLRHEVR